jgi:hypothetical protein
MNFETLKNRSVLMLGKSRAFGMSEFLKQMGHHNITCKKAMDDDVVAIVEGGLMNPLEQDLLETLYFKKEIPIIRVKEIECELARYIDENKLLMSLKLSKDSERLRSFLKNPLIGDGLFLKLLRLYDFKDESFFGSDENRDVTTSLIERFYDDLQANHNIQYISLGMIQLINKSLNCELINTLASLNIVVKALRKSGDELLEIITHSLARHYCLSEEHQLRFATNGSSELGVILASRNDLNMALESLLLTSENEAVRMALASNERVSAKGIDVLRHDYERTIILHVKLNDVYFNDFVKIDAQSLAQNPTLNEQMITTLLLLNSKEVNAALARNRVMPLWLAQKLLDLNEVKSLENLAQNNTVPLEILEMLYGDEHYHSHLACNTSISEAMVTRLSKSGDVEILKALAQNSATPLNILYDFLLDMRLENLVRQNPALNEKYQR